MNVKESLPIRKQLLTDFQQQLQLKANATKTFQEPIVKTIFSTPLPSANFNTTSHADNGALSDHSNSTTKRSLSKLVEFPGDPEKVKLLVLDETIDLDGKDMFGLTALHKVCAWDKVDLLAILLPYLSMEQVNSVGGKEGYYPLHHCVALGAKRTLQYLLTDPRVDIQLKDKANRTYIELASETNQLHLLEH